MTQPGRLKIRENDTWRYTGHGVQGTSGMSGWSGVSGQSGWSGESGYSGYSSYSGISGQSGWSSHSGISGQSGWSGESGQSGTSGMSGWSGLQGIQGESGPLGITTLDGLLIDVSKNWSGYGISGMSWLGLTGPINIADTNGVLGGIRLGSPPDTFIYRTTPSNLAISGAVTLTSTLAVNGATTCAGMVKPSVDNTYSLGDANSMYAWSYIFSRQMRSSQPFEFWNAAGTVKQGVNCGAITTTGTLALASSGNITNGGANARRTIILTAGGAIPRTTNGCASYAKTELVTNDVMIGTIDFADSASTILAAQWNVIFPDNWDKGAVTAQYYWTAASGSGSCRWLITGTCYADSSPMDYAFPATVYVDDTLLTANDMHISPASGDITLGASAIGGPCIFQVSRDVVNDTLTSAAKLMMVKISYGINKYSDV